jgi:hypothetical protein
MWVETWIDGNGLQTKEFDKIEIQLGVVNDESTRID